MTSFTVNFFKFYILNFYKKKVTKLHLSNLSLSQLLMYGIHPPASGAPQTGAFRTAASVKKKPLIKASVKTKSASPPETTDRQNQDEDAELLGKLDNKFAAHKDFISDYINRKVDEKSSAFYQAYKKQADILSTEKKPVIALAMDTSAFSTDFDPNAPPRTARLWTNLAVRGLGILPLSVFSILKDWDSMSAGEIFVSSILWPSEDIPALTKRYRDIRKGVYKEKPLPSPRTKYKDVKNLKDYSRYMTEQTFRFWKKYGMTTEAIRTTLPFVLFDALALTGKDDDD